MKLIHNQSNTKILPTIFRPTLLLPSSSSATPSFIINNNYNNNNRDLQWRLQEADILSLLQKYTLQSSPYYRGEACHSHLLKRGFLPHTSTSNILLNFYSKFDNLPHARLLFDEMPELSTVSWNTLISSLVRQTHPAAAFHLLLRMLLSGFTPNEFTISTILRTCAVNRLLPECTQLHALAHKTAAVSNLFVATALLDVYAKCSLIGHSLSLFSTLSDKSSSVTWSSMIAGCVQNKLFDQALLTFHQSLNKGIKLDEFTLSSALAAGAGLATLSAGRQVHSLVQRTGLASNPHVLSSLIDMYSKCGTIEEALLVFSTAKEEKRGNVVTWNSMISGFSRHGRLEEAIECFRKMKEEGVVPDGRTFLALMTGCGHAGRVEEAWGLLGEMVGEHRVGATGLHYSCMADGLGRGGRVVEARELVERMGGEGGVSAWGAVLAGCRKEGVVEGAEEAAGVLFGMEEVGGGGGSRVMLADIYSRCRRWGEAEEVRREKKKVKGVSWVEVKGRVHSFMAGERFHHQLDEVYFSLHCLMREVREIHRFMD